MNKKTTLEKILNTVRACHACEGILPFPPNPILRAHPNAKLLIVGQAPGIRVHKTGIPWNDPSGDTLRTWLGLNKEIFYDCQTIAIIPMGYCYPGKSKQGDLPPRSECSKLWLQQLLTHLPHIQLTLLIGHYAQRHYLSEYCKPNLTATVKAWRSYLPQYFPLPHPSPRNRLWLRHNPWFETEVLPVLVKTVHQVIY